jgi:hypothetical protein
MSRKPQPPPERFDPTKIETRDDIVMIRNMWLAFPWLYDAESEPVGFQVPVYFVSGETEKGAFVPGRIYCRAYRILRTHGGSNVRELLHEWAFDEKEAIGFRATKKFILGNCYGFMLTWPKDVRVSGQEIEVEFAYERLNGSVVTGTPRRLQVPAPGQQHTPTIGSSEHYVRNGGERRSVQIPADSVEDGENRAVGQPRIQVRTSTRKKTPDAREEPSPPADPGSDGGGGRP